VKKNPIKMAIAYDFDGTLAPGNMQEYDFVPSIGMTSEQFWNEARELEMTHKADRILAYMRLMLQKAQEKKHPSPKARLRKIWTICPFVSGSLRLVLRSEFSFKAASIFWSLSRLSNWRLIPKCEAIFVP